MAKRRRTYRAERLRKPSRESSCEGKRRYESRLRAEAAAKRVSEDKHEPMHAYPCSYCHRWHLGHKPDWM